MARITALGLAIVLTGWATFGLGTAGAANPAAKAPLAKDWQSGDTKVVRALDDPANPYRDKYGPVDRWAWEHALDPAQIASVAAYPPPEAVELTEPTPVNYSMPVDKEGWPVPFDAYLTMAHAREKGMNVDMALGAKTPREYYQRSTNRTFDLPDAQAQLPADWPTFSFPVQGEMPPAVYNAYDAQLYADFADRYPPIPAWLGENTPQAAVFLPDGTILCYGPLGRHYLPDSAHPNSDLAQWPGVVWYRYSADGKLLESHPALSDSWNWMTSWNSKLTELEEARLPSGRQTTTGSGFAVLGHSHPAASPAAPGMPAPSSPADVVAAFAWDGTELPLDGPLPANPPGTCQLLRRDTLLPAYRAQLRAGRTTRSSLSPYAGQPDGPVTVDPAPIKQPLLAFFSGSQGRKFVEVRPLDDPASPYHGQYDSWDQWTLDNANRQDPAISESFNNQSLEWDKQARAARKAGKPAPPRPVFAYPFDLHDNWHSLKGEVDAQGYLIPHRLLAAEQANQQVDRRTRRLPQPGNHYTLAAGGTLSDAEYAQYNQALYLALRRSLPPFPQWLKVAPARLASMLPDGTLVTYGTPGSYNPQNPLTTEFHGDQSVWRRYGADGVLLAECSAVEHDNAAGWLALTFPGVDALAQREQQAGHGVEFVDGFTMVYAAPLPTSYGFETNSTGETVMSPPMPALVAAYDWNGAALDITQPLLRPDMRCMTFDWSEVLRAEAPVN